MTDPKSDRPKPDMADMSEAEMSMRKFLKALGVTTHQKLEAELAERVASGSVAPGAQVEITASIAIGELDFSHEVSATLTAPERG